MSKCNENIFTCPSNDTALDMRQATSNIPQCHPKGIFIKICQAAASNTPTSQRRKPKCLQQTSCAVCGLLEVSFFPCLDQNDFSLCGVFFIIIIKFVKMQISSPLFVVCCLPVVLIFPVAKQK